MLANRLQEVNLLLSQGYIICPTQSKISRLWQGNNRGVQRRRLIKFASANVTLIYVHHIERIAA